MALASELGRLRKTVGSVSRGPGVSSLLFDEKEALRTPLDDVAALGANGCLQLSRLDRRFLELEGKLFSGKVVDRLLLDKEEERALAKAVKRFCILASPYFLMRPAQK